MRPRAIIFAMLLPLVALLLPTPAAAVDFQIQCWLFDHSVDGDGASAGAQVTVTLKNSADVTKGLARDVVGADGKWHAELSNWSTTLQPGDKVHVDIGGTAYDHQLPRIDLKGIDPAGNRITGRIQPRHDQVLAHVEQDRLKATGWVKQSFDSDPVTTNADGSFTIDTTSQGNLRRMATVYVGYLEAPFVVGRIELSPGMVLYRDRGTGYLGGINGSQYEARLLGPGGVLRDSFVGTVTSSFQTAGVMEFTKGSGVPYVIRTGNQVQLIGAGDYTVTVPPLAASLDAATNVASVKTLANHVVEIYVEHFNDSGDFIGSYDTFLTTDAAGEATYDLTSTVDITAGDVVEVTIQDAEGNTFEASAQALP